MHTHSTVQLLAVAVFPWGARWVRTASIKRAPQAQGPRPFAAFKFSTAARTERSSSIVPRLTTSTQEARTCQTVKRSNVSRRTAFVASLVLSSTHFPCRVSYGSPLAPWFMCTVGSCWKTSQKKYHSCHLANPRPSDLSLGGSSW